MISSGDRLMPPSIGLKMSAVICGKSAVVFPAAFASSVGSFFLQPEKARDKQAPRQIPAGMRRGRSRLAWRNACTEPSLISLGRTERQDNSGSQGLKHPLPSPDFLPAALLGNLSPRDTARTTIHYVAAVQR